MVPGRTISIGYVVRALKRRRWWVIAPIVTVTMLGGALAWYLPNKFASQTVILVVPQRVPESYVKSTVTLPIENRLRSMQEQILSRTRLERIIVEFNLYPELRKTKVMDDVIAKMIDAIGLQIGKEQSFTLTFAYTDAQTAAKVTDRLASLFIDENLRDREVQAVGTSQFLEAELEEARRRLMEHEKKLKEYRERYAGQLPSQLPSNLQVIQTTQLQIQSLEDGSNRYRDQRLAVERQVADAENTLATPPPLPVAPARDGGASADPAALAAGTPAQQLDAANRNLRALETRGLTAEHPDVIRARRVIRDLEARVAADAATATNATKPAAPVTPQEAAMRNRLSALRTQLETIDRQIASNERDAQALRQKLNTYQARVEAVPGRESELTDLNRDYSALQASYQSLLAKREDSQIAANLERRQAGEQFKVLDAARVPEKPLSPNRPLLCGGAVFLGLVLGIALGGAREFVDSSLRSEDDVLKGLELPVLALVPMVVTTVETVKLRRRARVLWTTSVAVCTMLAGLGLFLWKSRF
jgi:polysaccharide chain length determinant protein (PEP-CTERM system associated)